MFSILLYIDSKTSGNENFAIVFNPRTIIKFNGGIF